MKNEIFVIYNKFKGDNSLISAVDNVAFTDKEKAIEYIKSKMTSEEIEFDEKAKNRNLMSWYEFDTKNYIYYIKVVSLL